MISVGLLVLFVEYSRSRVCEKVSEDLKRRSTSSKVGLSYSWPLAYRVEVVAVRDRVGGKR